MAQEAPAEPEPAPPETRGVLIATRYLPVGTLIAEADMVFTAGAPPTENLAGNALPTTRGGTG